MVTLHQNSSAFVAFGASSTTGKFLVTNLSSNQDLGTGIQFAPPGLSEASRPDISSSADGKTLTYNVAASYFKGTIVALGSISTNGDLGLGSGKSPAYLSGDGAGNATLQGSLLVTGTIALPSHTRAQILAFSSPVEGQMAYDSDDHEGVTYRCPTTSTCGWFPTTYGAAISN